MRQEELEPQQQGEGPRWLIPLVSRRSFIRGSGAVVVAGASALTACGPGQTQPNLAPGYPPIREEKQYPEVPAAPDTAAEQNSQLKFFQPQEAQTVDVLTSRILPGSADDPGAHEAGVLYYIDNALATSPSGDGWNEPHYRSGPFAKPYEGDSPPGPDTAETVYVQKSELPRYGYQSKLNPQQVYRQGLTQLDQYCKTTFGQPFASLSSDQQDQVVGSLADGAATGFDDPTVDTFWSMVRQDVINGVFSDPLYGGNRNMAGWVMIGYPGAQRAYTPHDIKTPGTALQPQGLAQLPHFRAGLPSGGSVVRPVSGSYQYPGNSLPSGDTGGNP